MAASWRGRNVVARHYQMLDEFLKAATKAWRCRAYVTRDEDAELWPTNAPRDGTRRILDRDWPGASVTRARPITGYNAAFLVAGG